MEVKIYETENGYKCCHGAHDSEEISIEKINGKYLLRHAYSTARESSSLKDEIVDAEDDKKAKEIALDRIKKSVEGVYFNIDDIVFEVHSLDS